MTEIHELEACAYGQVGCTVCNETCNEVPGQPRVCGDGTLDAEEECDDGNIETEVCEYGLTSCTICAADCTNQAGATRFCGDGILDTEEECDDGNLDVEQCAYGEQSCIICDAACKEAAGQIRICGDTVEDTEEDCDEGHETATCDGDCTDVECGDGRLNTEAEKSATTVIWSMTMGAMIIVHPRVVEWCQNRR